MEKYSILLEYGLNRIIAEGPLQTLCDNSEHGGYRHFIFNMRVENIHGNILSPILNKISFSEMRRAGADLDEEYSMEGFYLINETFRFLTGTSRESETDPSIWRSCYYNVSSCNMEVRNVDVEDFKKGIERCDRELNVTSIEILNKYLNEIIFFEKENNIPHYEYYISEVNNTIISWDDSLRVLKILPLIK